MNFAFTGTEVRANWFFGSLLKHKFETCIDMPIGFPNDSMRTRIRLIADGVSYGYSPIAPNGCECAPGVFILNMSYFDGVFTPLDGWG